MPDAGGAGLPIEHLRRLQAVTTALLAPRTVEQVAAATAVALVSAFSASGAVVLLEGEDRRLAIAGSAGVPDGDWEVSAFVAGGTPGAIAMTLERPLAVEDRALLELIAGQVATAIARTLITGRERHDSAALQRGLASSLPELGDGIEAAARYAAGGDGIVGGDWFDLVPLAGDAYAAVVGDVGGHGLEAAPEMDRIRSALEAYLVAGLGPGRALGSANVLRLTPGGVGRLVTATCVLVGLRPRSLLVATAGHPAPVLRDDHGSRLLDVPPGPPLGADPSASYLEWRVVPEGPALLVLATDGLIERRRTPIDERMERLREAVASAPGGAGQAADHVFEAMGGTTVDDGALLVVRLAEPVT